jgi:glycine oxidase
MEAGYGVLAADGGGSCDIPALVEGVVAAAIREGCEFRRAAAVGWRETSAGVEIDLSDGSRVDAERLLCCLGAGTPHLEQLPDLGLGLVKGQAARIRRPEGLPVLPPISAGEYIVDEGESLFVGSTYEHEFENAEPVPGVAERLVARAARIIPALAGACVIGRYAAVRAAPPDRRNPILGPIGPHGRNWVFTGLGSRGLMLAPLLGAEIPRYFHDPDTIPDEISLP